MQYAGRAQGQWEPYGRAQGHTRAPSEFCCLVTKARTWKDQGSSLNSSCLMQSCVVEVCLRWVLLQRLGLSFSPYSLEWGACWRDPLSPSCPAVLGVGLPVQLFVGFLKHPRGFGQNMDLCKPNTSFATVYDPRTGWGLSFHGEQPWHDGDAFQSGVCTWWATDHLHSLGSSVSTALALHISSPFDGTACCVWWIRVAESGPVALSVAGPGQAPFNAVTSLGWAFWKHQNTWGH